MFGGNKPVAMSITRSLLVLVAISFQQLFTFFHKLFFQGDSWLFNFSDTLIRLFPMTLWQNAFIAVGVVTLIGAGVLIWIGRKWG